MTSVTDIPVGTSQHESEPTVDESQTESQAQSEHQESKLLVGILFALFLSVVGATVIGTSWDYGLGTTENLIGPGTAPVVLGSFLIIGGAWIAAKDAWALRKLRTTSREDQEPSSGQPLSRQYLLNNIGLPVGIVLLYSVGIFMTQFTGVFLSLSIAVLVCALVIERVRLRNALLMAGALIVMGFALFELLLGARLPEGLVGF